MLDYLPGYYAPNTHVRNILQAEGLEMDDLWNVVRDNLPTITNPATCPVWALPMWEVSLGLADRSSWLEADRRTALVAFFVPATTETEIIAFLAAQVPTDPANIILDVNQEPHVLVTADATHAHTADSVVLA